MRITDDFALMYQQQSALLGNLWKDEMVTVSIILCIGIIIMNVLAELIRNLGIRTIWEFPQVSLVDRACTLKAVYSVDSSFNTLPIEATVVTTT